MSFSNKIKNYTNSVSSENTVDALAKAVDYVIGQVNNLNSAMLRLFAYKINLGTSDGTDIDWVKSYSLSYLIDVQRGTKFCRPITDRQADDTTDATSIYYALANDPAYYLDGQGLLNIKPAPVNSAKGYLYAVPNSAGRLVDDINERISIAGWTGKYGEDYVVETDAHFPAIFKELVVMHAAECILMERLADFRASIPAGLDDEWADALDKAKKLFDDGAGIGGNNAGASMSVQYWLSDEDEDMTGATLQAISSEINRANAYQLKFKTDIEKLATDYQWTQGQLQLLGQKKQEFIQANIKAGPQGDPEQESKI
jgi:hypothetical protein